MTGTLAFNPDAFVPPNVPTVPADAPTPAPIPHSDWRKRLPHPWAVGLAKLAEMPSPYGCPDDRWRQVIADSVRFSRDMGEIAIAAGWSVGNLFGYNVTDPGVHGLVLDIRGGCTIAIEDRVAILFTGGAKLWRERSSTDDAPLLWNIRKAIP